MAKSAVAPDHREWPEYEFREYPKHLGFDEAGVDIEVANKDEEAARAGDVVYPKLLGQDKNGNDVIAYVPAQEGWKKTLVVKGSGPAVDDPRAAPAALKDDGPTIKEWVEGGQKASDYPPAGYSARSTPQEIAAAMVEEIMAKKAADEAEAASKPDTQGSTGGASSRRRGMAAESLVAE